MSMISEQVKELRKLEKDYSKTGFGFYRTDKVLRQAANTIEALSAKLQAENMERTEDCGGWIACEDGLEPIKYYRMATTPRTISHRR